MEVRQVRIRTDGIKYITISKSSNINAGDYVRIIKLEEKDGTRKTKGS